MNAWPCTCALSLRPVGAAPRQAPAAQCRPLALRLLFNPPPRSRQRLAPTQRTWCRAWQRTIVGHVSDERVDPDTITASS
ncbi:hypothetical protein EDB85DRAFT_1950653 [Lactarius pseudohatsudake]|nr:hypothetical protein EDB85DRAFT_1950653 [Lactarius pseudohatsudake]